MLHYFEGLSTEATAQRLGCPRGTVLSRLSRARSRIKERLEREGSRSRCSSPLDEALTRWIPPVPVPAGLAQTTVQAASCAGPGRRGDRERRTRDGRRAVAGRRPHPGAREGPRGGCPAPHGRGGRVDRVGRE